MADKRLKLMTGSLRRPLFRYVQSLYISYYPYSPVQGKHFFDRVMELCRKYEKRRWVEEYSWKAQIFNTYEPDKHHTCQIKFIDGSTFNTTYCNTDFNFFVLRLRLLNDKLEDKRSAQGHDDEPEDMDTPT